MAGMLIRLALAAAIFLACALAAAEPPADETLPAPRAFHFQIAPLPPDAYGYAGDVPEFPAYQAYQRKSAYAYWQLVGVNRQGFFRPLVVYSPYMPYYRYNGEPYLFAPMHQRDFMPYIVGAPNR